MQARRIARELALLGISQLPTKPERLQEQDLYSLLLAAVRALSTEVRDVLETAAADLIRASDRLTDSDRQVADNPPKESLANLRSATAMVREAIELAQTAINRLGGAVDLPEFIQLAHQPDVLDYGLQILTQVHQHRDTIDNLLNQSMVDWQVSRLARIDRDMLRIAVAEIMFLQTPPQIAINEAVELAKRYSGDNGHRFINGVLRRVVDHNKIAAN
ncbi:MAG: transcription antitermination factor NusB [Cyanobacteria bacterium]|nr:transcription antitermination factor NusB [Cyanobacteriota bacterium]MDW8200111.1 transcription antitermination factor NusB [Cyanobacteriota bacterium SKYGB_h_bin112]